MNIYKLLNEAVDYIENNLEEKVEYKKIAQIMGMNEYSMQTIFYAMCNISLSDYIRKRRLSNAGYDLYNTDRTILEIALKYQYNNATSFSRAFEKLYGIKPSKIRNNPNGLKMYLRIKFDEKEEVNNCIEYSIIDIEELELYGIGKKTTVDKISIDAPKFWKLKYKQYGEKYGEFDYGMTSYVDRFNNENCEYYVLYNRKVEEKDLKKIIIPKSKWIKIGINSQKALDIQSVTNKFYKEFIPSSSYKFRELPELEHYHDGIVDFLIPIEEN